LPFKILPEFLVGLLAYLPFGESNLESVDGSFELGTLT